MNIFDTIGQIFTNTTDAWDNFRTGGANQTNKEMNDENIEMQKETNELNEKLMREQWDREDTSYTRTVKDMLNAGLSPLAMNGMNGAGSVVGKTAPQNTFGAVPIDTGAFITDSILGGINAKNEKEALLNEGKKLDLESKKMDLELEKWDKERNPFKTKIENAQETADFVYEQLNNVAKSEGGRKVIQEAKDFLGVSKTGGEKEIKNAIAEKIRTGKTVNSGKADHSDEIKARQEEEANRGRTTIGELTPKASKSTKAQQKGTEMRNKLLGRYKKF